MSEIARHPARAWSRRDVLTTAAGLAAANVLSAAPAARPLKFSVFAKHLQFLTGEKLARATAEIGFDGIDLAVRRKGNIEPDRAAKELPPLVKILREHKVEAPMITSGIVDAETPHAEALLRTISELGIRYYRWGGFRYDPVQPIAAQLEALKPRVAKLAALNRKYNVCAIYHTHSGLGQVGASIWDLYIILKDFDPNQVAVNYDVAHATIEGGYGGWINSLRVTGPHLKGVAVKDFVWARNDKGDWRPKWCPVGEGMVNFPQFFKMLAQTEFAGPIQVHYEYPLGGADKGAASITIPEDQVFAAMKKDLKTLRSAM